MSNENKDPIEPESTDNPGERQRSTDRSASSGGVPEESKGDAKKQNKESHKPTADNGSEDSTDATEPENVDIESRQDNEQDQLDDSGRDKDALN